MHYHQVKKKENKFPVDPNGEKVAWVLGWASPHSKQHSNKVMKEGGLDGILVSIYVFGWNSNTKPDCKVLVGM